MLLTVDDVIKLVYGDNKTAAERLGVGHSATWNWRNTGLFPPRYVSAILRHAKDRNITLFFDQIPSGVVPTSRGKKEGQEITP